MSGMRRDQQLPVPTGPEAFVLAEGDRLLRAARLLTGDWESGADLAQETLVRVWQAWGRIRDPHAARSYAHTTMVRLWYRTSKARRREIPMAEPREVGARATGSELSQVVLDALGAIPAGQRTALVLRYYLDLSVDDVAAVMRCSQGTVKSQTARGLAALRRDIQAHDQPKEAGDRDV
ncbi:SigE family RNA polymerase sigma factor [Leekyejoonella antrihumi]|uniref:SigE family RNA polymerase sigma factor n=1 Tax=Leekyejoonella antrihumi TaxID=1660198 RepID=A0A563DVK5_9MICO|nr:SigE family RNA polymerase sigma factor [Leekyejoonella antrihumi]TWP34236.1 SigE family RNA polymerase sigma factor [Leekyejoonella antrihumi]